MRKYINKGKHMHTHTHKNTPALLQESPSWKCCQSILLWDVTECFSGFCLCHMPFGTNVSTRVVAVCLYPQESLACFMLLSWLRTKTPDMSWPDSILVTWTSGISLNLTYSPNVFHGGSRQRLHNHSSFLVFFKASDKQCVFCLSCWGTVSNSLAYCPEAIKVKKVRARSARHTATANQHGTEI